jgi:hypothetical protein
MILSLLGPFVPLVTSLLTKWIEKRANDAQLKKLAQEFMRAFQARGIISAEIKSDDERQKKELGG